MKKIIRDEILMSDFVAIADDKGNKITYKELAKKAEGLAQYLEERSLVFCLCDHQMETMEFIYEILYLNRVPLLLEADMNKEILDCLVRDYQPQYIYCKKSSDTGREYVHKVEMENHVLLRTDFERYPIHSDVALLLSTSGTTGSKKLVKISYDNMIDNAEYGCAHLKMQSGQKGLSPLPVNYAYGISFCIWHWYCGATLLVTENSVLGNEFQKFYAQEKVNNFAATPFTYQILQRLLFWDSEKVEYLNYAISAGAQMPESVQEYLVSEMKKKFWNGYGQTECFGVLIAANFELGSTKFGSIGKPFQNAEVIVDSDSNEMLIISQSVCMGYAHNREQLDEGNVNQGILHTGDVIEIDGEGYIFLRGRLKRYVKILGKRVSLDDLERYLENKYPSVDFACTGTDDRIFVFYTGVKNGLEKEIIMALDHDMNIPSRFISFQYLNKIPRNLSGKIAYAQLGKEKCVNKSKV